MRNDPLLSIGTIARRTGTRVSALRYYADEGLLPYTRNTGGHRLFPRSVIRRVSYILIAQQFGYSLDAIRKQLLSLPDQRTPTKADWAKLNRQFQRDIDQRIAQLQQQKEQLSGCIGCGCLSLQSCRLYNPDDGAHKLGSGPRYLLGDSSSDVV